MVLPGSAREKPNAFLARRCTSADPSAWRDAFSVGTGKSSAPGLAADTRRALRVALARATSDSSSPRSCRASISRMAACGCDAVSLTSLNARAPRSGLVMVG